MGKIYPAETEKTEQREKLRAFFKKKDAGQLLAFLNYTEKVADTLCKRFFVTVNLFSVNLFFKILSYKLDNGEWKVSFSFDISNIKVKGES